jgi:hypothetical protein
VADLQFGCKRRSGDAGGVERRLRRTGGDGPMEVVVCEGIERLSTANTAATVCQAMVQCEVESERLTNNRAASHFARGGKGP